MNVFLAHPKRWEEGHINEWRDALAAMFAEEGVPAMVIPGRDDFQAYMAAEGTFSAWAASIIKRRDLMTRERFYGAVVATTREVGKATADIIRSALDNDVPVLLMEPADENRFQLVRVTQQVVVNERDFINGWRLDT